MWLRRPPFHGLGLLTVPLVDFTELVAHFIQLRAVGLIGFLAEEAEGEESGRMPGGGTQYDSPSRRDFSVAILMAKECPSARNSIDWTQ